MDLLWHFVPSYLSLLEIVILMQEFASKTKLVPAVLEMCPEKLHFSAMHAMSCQPEGRLTVADHFCEYKFVDTFSKFRSERKKIGELLLIFHSLL